MEVLDNLIRTQIGAIEDLLERGSEIEGQIRGLDSNYLTQLSQYKDELRRLISSYPPYSI